MMMKKEIAINHVKTDKCEDNIDKLVMDAKRDIKAMLSADSKRKIETMIQEVEKLSKFDRLLFYLELPSNTSNLTTDPLRQPLNPLGSRSEIQLTIIWIKTHLEEDQQVSLPKHEVYDEYIEYCNTNNLKPLSTADFGKVMKQVYPQVRPRRLGTRGNSRYCYAGLKKKTKLDDPVTPDFNYKKQEQTGSDYEDNVLVSASYLIREWVEKLLGVKFDGLKDLAYYLLEKMYVDNKSVAAYALLSGKKSITRGKHKETFVLGTSQDDIIDNGKSQIQQNHAKERENKRKSQDYDEYEMNNLMFEESENRKSLKLGIDHDVNDENVVLTSNSTDEIKLEEAKSEVLPSSEPLYDIKSTTDVEMSKDESAGIWLPQASSTSGLLVDSSSNVDTWDNKDGSDERRKDAATMSTSATSSSSSSSSSTTTTTATSTTSSTTTTSLSSRRRRRRKINNIWDGPTEDEEIGTYFRENSVENYHKISQLRQLLEKNLKSPTVNSSSAFKPARPLKEEQWPDLTTVVTSETVNTSNGDNVVVDEEDDVDDDVVDDDDDNVHDDECNNVVVVVGNANVNSNDDMSGNNNDNCNNNSNNPTNIIINSSGVGGGVGGVVGVGSSGSSSNSNGGVLGDDCGVGVVVGGSSSSLSTRRRVSFNPLIVQDTRLPQSPSSSRKRHFSFQPISPLRHGSQPQSPTTASPFISPRSTPVPPVRSRHSSGNTIPLSLLPTARPVYGSNGSDISRAATFGSTSECSTPFISPHGTPIHFSRSRHNSAQGRLNSSNGGGGGSRSRHSSGVGGPPTFKYVNAYSPVALNNLNNPYSPQPGTPMNPVEDPFQVQFDSLNDRSRHSSGGSEPSIQSAPISPTSNHAMLQQQQQQQQQQDRRQRHASAGNVPNSTIHYRPSADPIPSNHHLQPSLGSRKLMMVNSVIKKDALVNFLGEHHHHHHHQQQQQQHHLQQQQQQQQQQQLQDDLDMTLSALKDCDTDFSKFIQDGNNVD